MNAEMSRQFMADFMSKYCREFGLVTGKKQCAIRNVKKAAAY